MSNPVITNGEINYGGSGGDVFYLPHSCDDWVIGNLSEAKTFAADLLKTIRDVEALLSHNSLEVSKKAEEQ